MWVFVCSFRQKQYLCYVSLHLLSQKKHINTLLIRIERKPCIFAKVDETQTTSQQGFFFYTGF